MAQIGPLMFVSFPPAINFSGPENLLDFLLTTPDPSGILNVTDYENGYVNGYIYFGVFLFQRRTHKEGLPWPRS